MIRRKMELLCIRGGREIAIFCITRRLNFDSSDGWKFLAMTVVK